MSQAAAKASKAAKVTDNNINAKLKLVIQSGKFKIGKSTLLSANLY